jgi:hypothetical protein
MDFRIETRMNRKMIIFEKLNPTLARAYGKWEVR